MLSVSLLDQVYWLGAPLELFLVSFFGFFFSTVFESSQDTFFYDFELILGSFWGVFHGFCVVFLRLVRFVKMSSHLERKSSF